MGSKPTSPFTMERIGVLMQPDPADPREASGVLNPGGARGPDGDYYLFPRVVAQGDISRIGRVRVVFDQRANPARVEWRGYALEPQESYEVTDGKGGVEDPRITYLQPLQRYVMTYTAYSADHTRVALAVSDDLVRWERLGPLHFATGPEERVDLNDHANKDAAIFPDVVADPAGNLAIAILHRPTLPRSLQPDAHLPAGSAAHPQETIWISYAPLAAAQRDIRQLTQLYGHRMLLRRQAQWEQLKIGTGAPPVRLPYGWLLLYHGVSTHQRQEEVLRQYCAGMAILDLADPTRVLYRSPHPILAPDCPYEQAGSTLRVVFPTATDLRDRDRLDVYYGAADSRIAVARMTIPPALPTPE
ncbi:MAG TPA: glycosidase [Chloroflexota bacterium]|nr:glycosidase [Chloroflexota bacterium]